MEPVEGKMERASNLGTIQTRLHRIAELASIDRPAGVRRFAVVQRTRVPEEPDAGIPHVRICEGPGRVTARVYSTPIAPIKNAKGGTHQVVISGTHLGTSVCGSAIQCGKPSMPPIGR